MSKQHAPVIVWRQLIPTYWRELGFLFTVAPAATVIAFLSQIGIGLFQPASLFVTARLIDTLIAARSFDASVQWWVVCALGLIGVYRLLLWIESIANTKLRLKLSVVINSRIHEKICSLDLATLEQASVQTSIAYLRDQAWRPHQMAHTIFQETGNVIASVSLFISALTFSPLWTLLFVVAVLPGFIASVLATRQNFELTWGRAGLVRRAWYIEGLLRSTSAIQNLTMFQWTRPLATQYDTILSDLRDKEWTIERRRVLIGSTADLLTFLGYVFITVRLVVQTISGVLSIGAFTMYSGIFISLERFLVAQSWMISTLFEHTKYLNAFGSLMALQPAIVDAPDARSLPDAPLTVEFQRVSFRYPGAHEDAIRDVSFILQPGERVALVGENGAGKSTLVKLFLRLYEPTSGEIFINGEPMSHWTLGSVRERVAVTLQDFLHLSFSAKQNIDLSQPANEVASGAVMDAARQAGIHEKLQSLPSGYETMLGKEYDEDGTDLSGGEWQKLALARSFARKASWLVLDEPTASLDPRSERHVFEELLSKDRRHGVLLISHRFSTVRMADRILVLQRGQIVEAGTHRELMDLGGLYAELCRLQTEEIKS